MLSKKVLKDIQSLSLKKRREETNLFLAEGPKIVSELLQLIPNHMEGVYATKAALVKEETLAAYDRIELITEEELEKISQLQTPNGVLAVVHQMKPVRPEAKGLCLYLDTIQDPGNLGTIIRTSDWFGVSHVVCSPGCAEVYNPKVVQSTMASIARVNVWYDVDEDWLSSQKVPVLAATLGGVSLTDKRKHTDAVLVIGNESKGIREEVLRLSTERITIPRRGAAESLNAAVAAGILLSYLT